MTDYKGTKDASQALGVKPATLLTAVWNGRIQAPIKGPGNSFLWTDADVQRAAHVFGVNLKQKEII